MVKNVTLDSTTNPLPEPFRLTGPQRLLSGRLYRLIGPAAAEFYEDMCKWLVEKPNYITAAHLVGHMLREIESAVRDILISLVSEKDLKKQRKEGGKTKDTHVREILLILETLGFKEADDHAQIWLKAGSGDLSLHKKAHRNNLDTARPFNEDFLSFCLEMDKLLYEVLDRFEPKYIEISKVIDELAQSSVPAKKDAESFRKSIPNNYVSWNRFFSQISNSAWLPLLKEQKIFQLLPNEERDLESGTQRRVSWAAADYLKKMAGGSPDLVTEILKEVSETDSPDVKRQLLEIIAELNVENIIDLFESVKRWAISEGSFLQLILTDPIEKIIGKLSTGQKEKETFELASLMIALSPDPASLSGIKKSPYRRFKPQSLMGEWHYNDFLEKAVKHMFVIGQERTFQILIDLLERFRALEHLQEDARKHRYNEHSYHSRIAIEEHGENRGKEEIEDALIDSIRDTGLLILKDNPRLLTKLVKSLLKKKWKIFYRIALHFISKMPRSDKNLTAKFLLNPFLFDNIQVQHEFADLLRSGFKYLSSKDKKVIFGFIEEAKPMERLVKKRDIKDRDILEKYKGMWRRDKLSYIAESLPKKWQDYYEKVTTEHGQPDHPDFPFYSEAGWVEPQSDFSAQQLVEMNKETLIETLKNWQPDPSEDNRFSEKSKSAFGREIVEAIKLAPKKFQGLGKDFEQLDPTYVRSYIEGFSKLIETSDAIDWPEMVSLCQWVASLPRYVEERKGGIGSQDPDWGWTKRAAVSFLKDGVRSNLVPFELREKLWVVIELLVEDPDPTSEDEKERGPIDAYSTAINSTRGEAMSSVMEYALWVYRQLRIEKPKKAQCFGKVVPEVQGVLERHLNPTIDPSLAIRAVYGRYLPWLQFMDENWVRKNIEKIFPTGEFMQGRYRAAWDTLMLYVPVFDKPFEVLKDKYSEAISYICQKTSVVDEFKHRDEKTTSGLMYYYGRGKIDLPYLENFWVKAEDDLRGHALESIGRNLKSAKKTKIPEEVIQRYKVLWEARISEAKKAKDKSLYQNEISAFGWWFASGVFDEKWSFSQYVEALDISKKDPSDYMSLERLEELAAKFPNDTLMVLEKLLIGREDPNWIIIGNKDQLEKIFKIILSSKNHKAIKGTRALLGRVMSRGYTELNGLLPLLT